MAGGSGRATVRAGSGPCCSARTTPRGGWSYVGHVGTGFSQEVLADLQRQLERRVRPTSPFDVDVPREHVRDALWVEPGLVGEVEFRQWTSDGRLRHPAWRGMRPDRDSDSVVLPSEI